LLKRFENGNVAREKEGTARAMVQQGGGSWKHRGRKKKTGGEKCKKSMFSSRSLMGRLLGISKQKFVLQGGKQQEKLRKGGKGVGGDGQRAKRVTWFWAVNWSTSLFAKKRSYAMNTITKLQGKRGVEHKSGEELRKIVRVLG